jgi:hypothetical protein
MNIAHLLVDFSFRFHIMDPKRKFQRVERLSVSSAYSDSNAHCPMSTSIVNIAEAHRASQQDFNALDTSKSYTVDNLDLLTGWWVLHLSVIKR